MNIMCEDDFAKAFNVRLADKCCANCKHSSNDYGGYTYVTCSHPKRNDGGNKYESGETTRKFNEYNAPQCYVCDGWEAKEGGAK